MMQKNRFDDFEKEIGYVFNDKGLLKEALTHSSYIREHKDENVSSNERLEFLGDAYLDAIAGEELFKRLPGADEGRLTKLRAAVVCEKTLAVVGARFRIGEYMDMGNGESKNGGRYRSSIMADAIEALIGAIYLDGGYEKAHEFVLGISEEALQDAMAGRLLKDYKSALQEKIQSEGSHRIEYKVDREEGPDHDKYFYVSVYLDGEVKGHGEGKTKKEAEQSAAKEALERG